MQSYIILTDSGSDFSQSKAQEVDVNVIDLFVTVEGEEPVPNSKMDIKKLYSLLRDKKKASTSAVNLDDFIKTMTHFLEEGKDILYIGFSSGLSSTYSAGNCAAEELREKYPDRKIYTVDSLCASLGQGLLVYFAGKMRLDGASIEEVRDFVKNSKLNLCHWFTVDDLFFLKRGGRVSAATAVVGTVLGIKPVMHVDNEGKLIKVSTVRGRKSSIDALFDKLKSDMLALKDNLEDIASDVRSGISSILKLPSDLRKTVFISHGDCEDDANYLANRLKNELNIKNVFIDFVGTVIGSHSGPGTLAIFYLGTAR